MTQGSHDDTSLVPVVQIACEQFPGGGGGGGGGAPQVFPQIDLTSPTQIESHVVAQQNESAAQILVTHGSQPETSLLPVEHSLCEQLPGGGGGGGGGGASVPPSCGGGGGGGGGGEPPARTVAFGVPMPVGPS